MRIDKTQHLFEQNHPEPDSPSFSPFRLQHLSITVNNMNFKLHSLVNIFITVISAQEEETAIPTDDT